MSTASVIVSKPYGYNVAWASVGTIFTGLVKLNTIVWMPTVSLTGTTLTITDTAGGVLWSVPPNQTVSEPIVAYFDELRVDGLKITASPPAPATSGVIVINLA